MTVSVVRKALQTEASQKRATDRLAAGSDDPTANRLAVFDHDETLLNDEPRISTECADRLRQPWHRVWHAPWL